MSTYAGDAYTGAGDTAAAFAAGMAECAGRQGHMYEPMGGATPMVAESTQQPFDYEQPGEAPESGATPGYGGVT